MSGCTPRGCQQCAIITTSTTSTTTTSLTILSVSTTTTTTTIAHTTPASSRAACLLAHPSAVGRAQNKIETRSSSAAACSRPSSPAARQVAAGCPPGCLQKPSTYDSGEGGGQKKPQGQCVYTSAGHCDVENCLCTKLDAKSLELKRGPGFSAVGNDPVRV